MALSNGKGFSNGDLIFLSPRSQKTVDGKKVDVEPHFEISRVGADKKIKLTEETCTQVSGDLIKLEFKEREFNGKINKHVVLYIKGINEETNKPETYHLDLSYRIATRALFNAILSLENGKNIKISYYQSKKGYESFSIWQNDELVKWKNEIKDLPVADVIKDKKGVVIKTDYSEVDQFYEDGLKELAAKLFGKVEEEKKLEIKPKATQSESEEIEDVPF